KVTKLFHTNKEVVSIRLDPMRETADINEKNNKWPEMETMGNFQLFKSRQGGRSARGGASGQENPMQRDAKKRGEELKPVW
ncbi:MAG: hypothetical protein JNM68_10280, partial [Dinghuibacter sp.]|nr:hypothetical protein [Dinghuibacter sp.]